MLSCAETWISYNSVDVIRPKRSRKYKVTLRKHVFLLFPLKWSDRMLTEILGYRLQIFLLFLLTYSDLEGTETLGFVPETLFFLFLLYIGLFQHSLFLIFLFITGRVNILWSCGFIQPIPDFYRPLAKSMLHPVKSHKYKSCIFFTASINLFYYFLQLIDRWQLIFYYYLKSTYIFARCPRHLNITCLKFLS